MAEDFLGSNYIQVNIGSLELSANHNITQVVEVCQDFEKEDKLKAILEEIHQSKSPGKVIIFVETKKKVEHITRVLRYCGLAVFCIHGDKSQSERDYVLREFRKGDCPILVATDVAARGLGEWKEKGAVMMMIMVVFVTLWFGRVVEGEEAVYVVGFRCPIVLDGRLNSSRVS